MGSGNMGLSGGQTLQGLTAGGEAVMHERYQMSRNMGREYVESGIATQKHHGIVYCGFMLEKLHIPASKVDSVGGLESLIDVIFPLIG